MWFDHDRANLDANQEDLFFSSGCLVWSVSKIAQLGGIVFINQTERPEEERVQRKLGLHATFLLTNWLVFCIGCHSAVFVKHEYQEFKWFDETDFCSVDRFQSKMKNQLN